MEQNLNEQQKINKYHHSKIYAIRSHQTNKIYIGSTTQQLAKRLYEHKHISNTTSKLLIEQYDDVYIELLELFKCENREELHKKEGEYMRLHKDIIVNKYIAGRTTKEYEIDNKLNDFTICRCGKSYCNKYEKSHRNSKYHILWMLNQPSGVYK